MARARLLWMGGMSAVVAASAIRELSPMKTAEPSLAAVGDQLTRGARLYALGCATAKCHGTHGEGVRSGQAFRVWPLVGPDFQVRNPNAQVIFDVVRSGSEQSLRAMTDQQI